jgi:tetratricopeptide (TPR) repeat protein
MIDRIRQAEEHYERGDKLDADGDTERAVLEWKRAIELNPNHFGAHYNLGISYADDGYLDAAIEELEMASAVDPDDAEARQELERTLIERSEQRMAQGNRMGAVADWNRTLEIDSRNALVHFYVGKADFQDRDYANAIRHLRDAISNNRFFTDAYMQLADAYLTDDQPQQAIDILRQALNVFHTGLPARSVIGGTINRQNVPHSIDISDLARKLARVELGFGNPDQAMAALENAQPSRQNAELWREIAHDLQTRGDAENAEIALNRAAESETSEPGESELPEEEIGSGVADAHFARAEKLYEQGSLDDAFEEYAEAVRLNPDHAEAHHGMAIIYQDDEEYDLAEKEFREVLRIDSDHTDAHFGLGEVFDAREDWQSALAEYREVLRISPGYQDAQENVIWDLLELEDVTQSQMELERAQLADSIKANLWEELGKLYEMRGARGSAIAAYQRALGLNKSLKKAKEGLKKLGVN